MNDSIRNRLRTPHHSATAESSVAVEPVPADSSRKRKGTEMQQRSATAESSVAVEPGPRRNLRNRTEMQQRSATVESRWANTTIVMGQESDPVAEKGAGGDDDAESVEKKRTSDSSKVSKKG